MEAKIGRAPNLSSVLGLIPPPLLPDAMDTVTAADGTDVPSIANELGEAEQVAPEGAAHVRPNA